jgi:hypothetical protein
VTDSTSKATGRARTMAPAVLFTIAGVLGLFYAYVVWNAVTLLVYQAGGRLGLNGLGWFVLLFAIVFPIVAYAGAFALGWRRRAGEFLLILVTGLALVAGFWLSVLGYAYTFGAQLLGSS